MANEKRLIEYYDVAYQIQKLQMDAFRNVDKASCMAYRKALDILRDAPTVYAVEVVHGRWILKETCGKHTEKFHCSVCNKVPKSLCTETYCPHCGAKMDGGDASG